MKMIKRCKKCKVPLEGFGYKYLARPLFGIKPGKNGCCNKCTCNETKPKKKGSKR